MPVFWWVGLDLFFLVGRTTSGGVFWGFCELSVILGSLSANGWGCVPVLLVVWHGASALKFAGRWVELCLIFEMGISGRSLDVITWDQEVSGVLMS